ncbi:MAG: F0F1 ATP synthase subunit delta [Proteobacteria bacterium]|nr:F0F1 ATP synthase subunit delta [Pseudomonadota bacterium]
MSSEKAAKIASENLLLSGLSARYAVALFELAKEQKKLDQVADDMTSLSKLLMDCPELKLITTSPVISKKDQTSAMATMTKAVGFSKIVINFIGVITANRRLDQLDHIIDDFNKYLAHYRGEVNAVVLTAHKLNKNQLAALGAKLKSMVGSEVNIETDVDEELLGGMIVRIGSSMIDSSLKTKLANLEATMKEVG